MTTDDRRATFDGADLRGATFRDCDLTGARITSSVVTGLRVDGFGGEAGQVVVDGVDVSAHVAAELDRRHPERVLVRGARSADALRGAWAELDRLWADTVGRGEGLPEQARHERVEGEWSLAETLRHLVFAVDVWVGRMVGGGDRVFSPIGLPPTDYPVEDWPALGIDPAAAPTWAEVVAESAGRRAQVTDVLAGLDDAVLDEVRTAVPAPAWGEESHPVRGCLRVVLHEHAEHRRFAERDLAVLLAC